ncbi:hypothetical protein HHI36_020024 [Cryptolaemus montrouzieri]|uniref:DUF5641 domain-containing protein n=1 Tax=Cryptolaemus montrouzieri TaxID=559131 RepID=A0ABD2NA37_9CUCU
MKVNEMPPHQWILGHITEIFPGRDNQNFIELPTLVKGGRNVIKDSNLLETPYEVAEVDYWENGVLV